jgi:hypothetical protein
MRKLIVTIFGFCLGLFFGIMQAPGDLGYPVGQAPWPELLGYAAIYAFIGAMLGFIVDACRWPSKPKEHDHV